MAFPTVIITITLGVPATGFATSVATACPQVVANQIAAEAIRLIRAQNPSSRFESSATGPVAGQDAINVVLTSVAVT